MTTYDLFNGFIEALPATWSGAHRMGDDNVNIEAADAMKILNLARVSVTRGVETVTARINALLDEIAWPSVLRAIDVTETTVQAITLENVGILSHIQEAAASEGGVFFISANGTPTFYDRNHTITLDETNDVWGDQTGEKHYASVTTSYDDSNLWNQVVVTAEGLTDQVANDSVSQSTYGGPGVAPRTLTIPTLLTTEAEMLERAESLLAKYSQPEFRITSLTIDQGSLDDTQWPRMLTHDIHARIIVNKRPEGDEIHQPSFIEGIQWSNDAGHWTLTWNLSSTLPQVGQWELGTVGLSELGVTTSLVNTIA